ncbi:ABC transporter ATP-binding protein [Carnobacterium maltaromaticum]|uniref:ABC transporter ATP-binding protein n=1 Tax=Carnobacterium maltaromaticum TaxID=2751 RepID=UPI003850FAFD
MAYAIEMTNINKIFKDKIALNQLSFKVNRGEIFGFLGPSGSGKTTTIKLLTGQMKATSGSATILGRNIQNFDYDFYKNIGIVTDNSEVIKDLSCYDNLKLFADIYQIPNERIDFLLERTGLLKEKKKKAGKLSRGMIQRLLLARALLHEPHILFLDEPTSGLDPRTMKDIHLLLLQEKNRGMTLFLTTHNMHEAEILCDHIALLHGGKIVECDTPKKLIRKFHKHPHAIVTYEGEDSLTIKLSQKEFTQLNPDQKIVSIHSNEPNLEEIFLSLTGTGLN